jgi:PRC-barrel domain
MLSDIAQYIAPAATMIAACMTAANLGPRVTGWGFVVFTTGSLAWSAIALESGQHSLLVTNAFLTLVNGVGVWRWLGRIARFDDGAKAAEAKSEQADTPTLTNVGAIEGRTIVDRSRAKIGTAIGVMAATETGHIAYIVAGLGGIGGIGERLVALPWTAVELCADRIIVKLGAGDIDALPDLDPADWPVRSHANSSTGPPQN